MKQNPLVSVIIPTHNRAELLISRAIPSVLKQTYSNLECIVIADRCKDNTAELVKSINDSRVKFVEILERPGFPDDLHGRWRVGSAVPRNKGFEIAQGEWVCLLDDDDEFVPKHIELLLNRALKGYDFVYGKALQIEINGNKSIIGKFPPTVNHIGANSSIYSSKYLNIKCNTDPSATWEPCDWNLCRRILEAGARVSFVNEIVYIHYEPQHAWKKQKEELEYDRQRFLPWMEGDQIHYEHLHRYDFCKQFVKNKKIIDLACGEGYGTYMLAKNAKSAIGIDIDEKTVVHAGKRYAESNLEYIRGLITDIPLKDQKTFDVAICLNAIEYISEHDKLMENIIRILKDDGILIVSTPNKNIFKDEKKYFNTSYKKLFNSEDLEDLLKNYFGRIYLLGQNIFSGSNIWNLSSSGNTFNETFLDKDDEEYYFADSKNKLPSYYIAVATNGNINADIIQQNELLIDISGNIIDNYENKIDSLKQQLSEKDAQIAMLQQGILNKISDNYYRNMEKLLPPDTRRRQYYEKGLSIIRNLVK